jgi:hypothetical protein
LVLCITGSKLLFFERLDPFSYLQIKVSKKEWDIEKEWDIVNANKKETRGNKMTAELSTTINTLVHGPLGMPVLYLHPFSSVVGTTGSTTFPLHLQELAPGSNR